MSRVRYHRRESIVVRAIEFVFGLLGQKAWGLLKDNCDVCDGRKGGFRGNENVVNGVLMCDYCTVVARDHG